MTKEKYYQGIGKRKTSIASVRLYSSKSAELIINNKKASEAIDTSALLFIINEPLELVGLKDQFKVEIKVKGGGISSQAEACRHAIARALEKFNPELRKQLKVEGFLKRDSRIKERKKPGLRRARRAPQWSKR